MKPCSVEGCELPKVPGGGQRYCETHKEEAKEKRRLAAIERTDRWAKANPERVKENNARAYAEHPERMGQWAKSHPELVKEYARQYYLANADRIKDRSREWYANNTDRAKENVANYRVANPDKVAAHDIARNFRRRSRIEDGEVEIFEPIEIFNRDGWICGICADLIDPSIPWPDPQSPSIDHIVPISLGGHHTRDNIQASHLSCNIRKSNRMEETG